MTSTNPFCTFSYENLVFGVFFFSFPSRPRSSSLFIYLFLPGVTDVGENLCTDLSQDIHAKAHRLSPLFPPGQRNDRALRIARVLANFGKIIIIIKKSHLSLLLLSLLIKPCSPPCRHCHTEAPPFPPPSYFFPSLFCCFRVSNSYEPHIGDILINAS